MFSDYTGALPVLGDYGVTYEDVYAALGTSGISYFLFKNGIIGPTGMSTTEIVTLVFSVVGMNLLIKHFMKTMREKNGTTT